jgi:hypothetical protein
MKKEEYYDRNYTFEDIEQDPRLARSAKEMKITVVYYTIYMTIVILVSYALATGPATEYTYLLGLPTYLTAMVIIALIGMVGVLLLTRCFTDDDLSPHIADAPPSAKAVADDKEAGQ